MLVLEHASITLESKWLSFSNPSLSLLLPSFTKLFTSIFLVWPLPRLTQQVAGWWVMRHTHPWLWSLSGPQWLQSQWFQSWLLLSVDTEHVVEVCVERSGSLNYSSHRSFWHKLITFYLNILEAVSYCSLKLREMQNSCHTLSYLVDVVSVFFCRPPGVQRPTSKRD